MPIIQISDALGNPAWADTETGQITYGDAPQAYQAPVTEYPSNYFESLPPSDPRSPYYSPPADGNVIDPGSGSPTPPGSGAWSPPWADQPLEGSPPGDDEVDNITVDPGLSTVPTVPSAGPPNPTNWLVTANERDRWYIDIKGPTNSPDDTGIVLRTDDPDYFGVRFD